VPIFFWIVTLMLFASAPRFVIGHLVNGQCMMGGEALPIVVLPAGGGGSSPGRPRLYASLRQQGHAQESTTAAPAFEFIYGPSGGGRVCSTSPRHGTPTGGGGGGGGSRSARCSGARLNFETLDAIGGDIQTGEEPRHGKIYDDPRTGMDAAAARHARLRLSPLSARPGPAKSARSYRAWAILVG